MIQHQYLAHSECSTNICRNQYCWHGLSQPYVGWGNELLSLQAQIQPVSVSIMFTLLLLFSTLIRLKLSSCPKFHIQEMCDWWVSGDPQFPCSPWPHPFLGSICFLLYSISSASFVAQLLKNLPAMQETWVPSQGWEDPLEKGKATHSSILAWRIPRTVRGGKSWTQMSDFHL